MQTNPTPKLFISYSWSSPDHEKWVLAFAEDLVGQGVDVILDKWHLKPGHDANAFMESMVTDQDVTKVVLICDRKYVEKSNNRSGGAGTEAQIISPELYAKKAQDKFVAVIRERDEMGKAHLPTYYGSRIYFDLSDPATYAKDFENLVRWAWDTPVYRRPEIGKRPAFLSQEAGSEALTLGTEIAFRKTIEAIKSGNDIAAPLTADYFEIIASGLDRFRIQMNNSNFDDLVTTSVGNFLPYRNELIEIFVTIARYKPSETMVGAVHKFFEQIIPYMFRPGHVTTWHEEQFDNFVFIVHELYLYALAIFLKYQRFDLAVHLIENEYFFDYDRTGQSMHPSFFFFRPMRSFGPRSLRLGRQSARADLLKERNQASGVDFSYILSADLIMYLRSTRFERTYWRPETLIWTTFRGATLEMFSRAKSTRYFDRMKRVLGVSDKPELGALLDEIERTPNLLPRWDFDSINPRMLVQFDGLCTTP
jgi:hypothetical protein